MIECENNKQTVRSNTHKYIISASLKSISCNITEEYQLNCQLTSLKSAALLSSPSCLTLLITSSCCQSLTLSQGQGQHPVLLLS